MASDNNHNPVENPPATTDPPPLQDMCGEQWSTSDSHTDAGSPWTDAPRHLAPHASPAAPQGQTPTPSGRGNDQNTLATSQAHDAPDVPEVLRPGAMSRPGAPTATATHAEPGRGWQDTSAQPVSPPAPQQTHLATGVSGSFLQPDTTSSLGRSETNPFKRKDVSRQASQSTAPAQATVPQPPTEALSEMNIGEAGTNPWHPGPGGARNPSPVAAPPRFPPDLGPDPGQDAWQLEPSRQQPTQAPASPSVESVSSGRRSPAWDDLPENQTKPPPWPTSQNAERDVWENTATLDDKLASDKENGRAVTPLETADNQQPLDDWSLIDPASAPSDPQANLRTENKTDEPLVQIDDEAAPSLPPRHGSGQAAPQHSPRPVDSKSETYQIKNINWHDHNSSQNPRTSPVLVQNANGPCPLLALVNALTLSTPAEMADTSLVQVLRSREQISLGLLLDAVLDELMSPRRTSEEAALPDVGELYGFLRGLHTGMNVNPRFVPAEETIRAFKRTSFTHLSPTERDAYMPGTFEDTIEMSLYSAFSIPLIHGWLPTNDDPVYDAFSRQATSYDQVQNLLFREEELEDKLSQPDGEGLTEDEQQLYQDIMTIRSFLDSSATQLTTWGLEVMTKAMKPGIFAILFRNDHFSTLYRHPHTHQLLALVTDAGYATHAEVVWESLADVNGLNTEYLSGDFRIVGGLDGQHTGDVSQGAEWFDEPSTSTAGDQGQWTTVQRRRDKDQAPAESDMVQEDHDLALALQLQEEEDERHRSEEARRQRERQLSEQYIEQQARQPGPNRQTAPTRGGGAHGGRGGRGASQQSLVGPRNSSIDNVNNASGYHGSPTGRRQPGQTPPQQVRPLVPPDVPQRETGTNRPTGEGVDDAPPSYEQAQHSTPYNPPVGHPSHPNSVQGQGQGRGSPQQTQTNNGRPQAVRPTMAGHPFGSHAGRGRPVPPGALQGSLSGRDRDCVVM